MRSDLSVWRLFGRLDFRVYSLQECVFPLWNLLCLFKKNNNTALNFMWFEDGFSRRFFICSGASRSVQPCCRPAPLCCASIVLPSPGMLTAAVLFPPPTPEYTDAPTHSCVWTRSRAEPSCWGVAFQCNGRFLPGSAGWRLVLQGRRRQEGLRGRRMMGSGCWGHL